MRQNNENGVERFSHGDQGEQVEPMWMGINIRMDTLEYAVLMISTLRESFPRVLLLCFCRIKRHLLAVV
jgi:hypothetical protein